MPVAAIIAGMTTADLLEPFQWLNVSEDDGGGLLGVIFSVAYFRGVDPAEVVRRFSCGEGSGRESNFGDLQDRARQFVEETEGGDGGGYVGVVEAGEWCVVVEPDGWMVTLHEVVTTLSRGCEVLAVTRHDYAAEHSFVYAIDGTIVTGYRLRHPHERYGSDPDRLNGFMAELGMGLTMPDTDAAWDAAWEDNYDTAVPRGFALAAQVTGAPFTPDMLDRPMVIAPIVES